MRKFIFAFLLIVLTTVSFSQGNPDKIAYPRNTDELMNFMFQATLQGLRVIIIADSAGTMVTKDALDSAYATWAKQDTLMDKVDSLKNRIIELMAYQNSLKAKSDSLFAYTKSSVWDIGHSDTVTHLADSVTISGYTYYVSISVWGDSAFEISSTLAFTNSNFVPAGGSITIEHIPVASAGKIYIRKTSAYAGVMNWKMSKWGN